MNATIVLLKHIVVCTYTCTYVNKLKHGARQMSAFEKLITSKWHKYYYYETMNFMRTQKKKIQKTVSNQ